jgi:hypothetical protein
MAQQGGATVGGRDLGNWVQAMPGVRTVARSGCSTSPPYGLPSGGRIGVSLVLTRVARAREFRRLDRETWVLICLLSLPLGGILYLTLGKKWKVRDPGSVPRRPMWRAR